ncbi:unnamed protein product [Trypanosoma congolense IL3000]|uniref:WGS project CAEQ00000000 data, annotated contig 1314 n=1 Tax=Trypanosoma congolense (strain IL3000) TaxID=1068625 RepID=F9W5D3_TRYCI|nr:unnamed protein product [Trypanosoma congolense IL3000]
MAMKHPAVILVSNVPHGAPVSRLHPFQGEECAPSVFFHCCGCSSLAPFPLNRSKKQIIPVSSKKRLTPLRMSFQHFRAPPIGVKVTNRELGEEVSKLQGGLVPHGCVVGKWKPVRTTERFLNKYQLGRATARGARNITRSILGVELSQSANTNIFGVEAFTLMK